MRVQKKQRLICSKWPPSVVTANVDQVTENEQQVKVEAGVESVIVNGN
jgi:hypothetical protein